MAIDLDNLERLWAQTTPGTWVSWYREEFIGISAENRETRMGVADVEYITALINAAPDLIERVRALEQQIKELRLWNYEFQREKRKLQFQLKLAQEGIEK